MDIKTPLIPESEMISSGILPATSGLIPEDQFTPANPADLSRIKDTERNVRIQKYDDLQKQYGGAGNTALAGLAGLARGVSLGTSDVALTKLGLAKPETLSGLQEANPISSGIGQLGGGAALLGATGGAGALTEGAGTLAKIAGTAAEGGLFGAGNAASEYAMGDPNLNAQKIAAHIGAGALFGGTLGVLGESVKAILPKTIESLNSTLEKVKSVTDSAIPTDISGPMNWADKIKLGFEHGTDGKKLTISKFNSILRDLYTGVDKGTEQLYEVAGPARMEESLSHIPVSDAKINGQSLLHDIQGVSEGLSETEPGLALSSASRTNALNKVLTQAKLDIDNASSASKIQATLRKLASRIDKKDIVQFGDLGTRSGEDIADQKILLSIRNSLRNNLRNTDIWGDAGNHYAAITDAQATTYPAKKAFEKLFMTKTSDGFVVHPNKIATFISNYNDPSQVLRKAALNNLFDSAAIVSSEAENYAGFKQGSDSISDYISKLAKKNEEVAKIADIMSTNKSSNGGLLSTAILADLSHNAGVPNSITATTLGMAKALQQVTNPYQLGANLKGAFNTLKSVGDVITKATDAIDNGAKNIFSKASSNVSSNIDSLSDKLFTKNSARISELANNPQALVDHLENTTSAISDVIPNISSGLHATITSAVQFLNSKLPRPGNEMLFNADWEPTPSQKSKFNEYYAATINPLNALKEVRAGTLSNETMEALLTVRPQLLKEMQQKVMENLHPNKIKNMDYKLKIALSKFLQMPLESSLLPRVITANQAALQLPIQSQQSPEKSVRGGHRSSLGGIKLLDGSSRALPMTQRWGKSK